MDTSPSLAPALLLSMPQLADPNFNRTVVLLCRHNEEGAFGLVVNRPVMTSGPVMVQSVPMQRQSDRRWRRARSCRSGWVDR